MLFRKNSGGSIRAARIFVRAQKEQFKQFGASKHSAVVETSGTLDTHTSTPNFPSFTLDATCPIAQHIEPHSTPKSALPMSVACKAYTQNIITPIPHMPIHTHSLIEVLPGNIPQILPHQLTYLGWEPEGSPTPNLPDRPMCKHMTNPTLQKAHTCTNPMMLELHTSHSLTMCARTTCITQNTNTHTHKPPPGLWTRFHSNKHHEPTGRPAYRNDA